ncbi:MAG: hypothetical protein ACLGHG_00875 [Gammaproteobacteria bacterium]
MRTRKLPVVIVTLVLLAASPVVMSVDLKTAKPAAVAPVAAAAREQQQVAEAVRGLGFTVGAVVPAGKGAWDVQVQEFDPARATDAMRGAVRGPQARFAVPGQAMAVRGGMGGGRLGVGGMRGIDSSDGSQTGGESTGGASGDLGGNGGGDQGGSEGGGAGAGAGEGVRGNEGGGSDPGVEPSGSPRSSTLRVSVDAGGALRVDAQSLRGLGLQPGAQRAGLTIR